MHEGLPELSLEAGTITEGNSLPLGLPQPMLYQGRIWGTVTDCVNAENSPGSGGSADPSAGWLYETTGAPLSFPFYPSDSPWCLRKADPPFPPTPSSACALPGSDPPTQLARLMKRNGLDVAEAEARISSQLPLEEKRKWATHVIDNCGDQESTRRQVLRLHAHLEDSLHFLWARLAVGTAVAGLGGLVFLLIRHFIS